jgi:TPR repeat protein
VHRAITTDDAASGPALPELTSYVLRAHDHRLRELLAAPAQPVMVVLVGGSSTGKTRAAFEAVRECLPDWSLSRPVDAAELVGQLTGGAVSARTVLWLDEAQVFLRDRPEAAAALRQLLTSGQPVAVVGTMWPQYWKDLTTVGERDIHHQARQLLLHGTVRVEVPEVFAGEDLVELNRKLGTDRRLDEAAEAARSDGKVIQVLAGGPALVSRYEHPADAEDRYGKAVVTTAMDVHRLGQESPIGRELLAEVAAVCVDPQDRIDAPAGWFDTGMAHATETVHGIAALTARREQPGTGPADGYVLHDYLGQYARTSRGGVLVPAVVWDALTAHTTTVDRIRLAEQARRRGLYRHAAALATPAAEAGDIAAMKVLAGRLDEAGRTEQAEQWWRRAAEAGDPTAVQMVAKRLDEAGRGEDADRVLGQAAEAGDSSAVLALAGRLDQAGRGENAEQLLRRAAEAGDTIVMERLAARLYEADRGEEAEQWLRRAAEAGDTPVIQILAGRLDEAGCAEEAEQWWRRAAESGDHFAFYAMVRLAKRFDDAGDDEEAEQWWRRAAESGHTSSMWALAGRLDQAGRTEEAEQWRRRAFDAGDYFAIWAALAQIEQTGRAEEAEQLLRPFADAGDQFARGRLVLWLDQAGRGEEAEDLLRRFAESGDLTAMYVLANRLDQAGRGEEAEQWRRHAIEIGGDLTALNFLAEQLDKTGRPDEAERLRRYGIEPGGRTADPWC